MHHAPSETTPPAPARASFPGWGGRVVVATAESSRLPTALALVRRSVRAFELACSSLRDDSELARLNAYAGDEVVVSALLFLVVREALRAARWTGGIVDPTVAPGSIATGAIGRGARAGHTSVKLESRNRSVTLPSGVRLDLSATAKALAADTAASAAAVALGCGVLVGIGGDVAVAGAAPSHGWEISLTDAGRHSHAHTRATAIVVHSGGVATSNLTTRRYGTGPANAPHLLDPLTGEPVIGPWQSAAVVARSCLQANVAATAAMILGANAPDWLAGHELAARLIDQTGEARYVGGWADSATETDAARHLRVR